MEEVVTNEEWMLETYDRIVAESGPDGITLKEVRDRAAQEYEEAIASGEIERPDVDLYAEGLANFDRVVRPKRQSRKSAFHNDIETITAALNDDTIFGGEDPILDIAYPLGTSDGRDKVVRFWTAEDWDSASMTRYRNAAEVTAAAQIFDEQASIISARLRSTGVFTTGGLFTSGPGSASTDGPSAA